MSAISRRGFLASAALSPLGVGLTGANASAQTPAPLRRLGGTRLKTSLNAYSFNKALNDQMKGRGQGVSLFDLIHFCAEQNIDALDPTGYFFPGYPNVPSDKYLNDFRRSAFLNGVEISGTGVRNNFASPDRAKRAADVQHVKEWVECASRMGAPVLRVFAGAEPTGHSWDEVASWMVDDLKTCVEHAEKHGVLIGIQNHGDMLKSADQVLEIVKRVDSEWFGVIVDTGYFLTANPYQDIARVIPHAVNWQIKEKVGSKDGPAKIDMKRLVKIIRESHYRGYLPIETLSAPGESYEPRSRVTALLVLLRQALKETE